VGEGYKVYTTVYGQDKAYDVMGALRGAGSKMLETVGGTVWVQGHGLLQYCSDCCEYGHLPLDPDCKKSMYVVRVDSEMVFFGPLLEHIIKITGAVRGFSGAIQPRPDSIGTRAPKNFAHLVLHTKAEAERAFLALLPVAQRGVLSRFPQVGWDNEGESTGIPGCCERCGMLDSDCVPGGDYMRHRWGDKGSCPLVDDGEGRGCGPRGWPERALQCSVAGGGREWAFRLRRLSADGHEV
jgi:hypothetical protein